MFQEIMVCVTCKPHLLLWLLQPISFASKLVLGGLKNLTCRTSSIIISFTSSVVTWFVLKKGDIPAYLELILSKILSLLSSCDKKLKVQFKINLFKIYFS